MIEYIKEIWITIGFLIFFISLLKNTVLNRFIAIILFLTFIIIAALRGVNYNQDTINYVTEFSSFFNTDFSLLQLFTWNWEPGYNFIIIILTKIFTDKSIILFFITFLPGIIFCYQFLKYNYSPSIILFIYSTMLIVATVATMRHWLALSISFVVINSVVFRGNKNILTYFTPILFHYSTIPLTFILIINSFKEKFAKRNLIILLILFIILIVIGRELLNSLYSHLIDRAIAGGIRSFGFRNILNIILIALILFSFKQLKIKISRMDFLLFSALIVSLILMPFYGLNRIISFFTLILLAYLQKYQGNFLNINNLILSFLSLLSLIFFYFNYSPQN